MAKQSTGTTTHKLTHTLIRALPPSTKPSGRTFVWDTEVKGLGAGTTAAGSKSFALNYKIGRRSRLLTIGSYPDWSPDEARAEAKALKQRIDRGEDPMADRHALRAVPTMADLAERYIADRERRWRPSTMAENARLIRQWIVPKLRTVRVADLTREDVVKLHAAVSDAGTKVRANRMLDQLRAMLNKSIEWHMRSDNPAQRIERNLEYARERYLEVDELRRLLAALNESRDQSSADVIRLCSLTGCRRGEALGARWDQFDLTAGTWVKPHSLTKQKRLHRIRLSIEALALLNRLHDKATGPLLFPAKDGNARRDVKNTWRAACQRAGLVGLRLHDLRHSFASFLVSNGSSLPLIGAMLGHSSPQTTARYAHLLDAPLRDAAQTVGSIIANASVIPPTDREEQTGAATDRDGSKEFTTK